ncbi:flavin monoamine oxidase [Planotetraspora silvatica]|uniref:Flavin monoamine oxidase n=1 Tax=Planotetraspora silvatica TaxID=234614 RepID=A0A8J3USC2_9ACTN|nr:flavin monoamine oxidase family protein [Planotetraspora silvatica]GII47519.1 flavin monoamine oxidase [Planotetraspora silvatica]
MSMSKGDGISRRALLVGLGVAGGAGAMYAAMGALGLAPDRQESDYAPPQRSDFALKGKAAAKVVILGGGVAGLATAYELGKAGYDCTVLEARDRVGGRSFTIRGGDRVSELNGETQEARFGDGVYFNAGPARIAQWMITLDYCRELGVPVEVFVNDNPNAYIYNHTMKAPVRARTARADTYGYVSELLAKATNTGALDRTVTRADREVLLDFLSEFGALDDDHVYRGSSTRGYRTNPGVDAGVGLGPVPSVSEVLRYGLGRTVAFTFDYDQSMPMFQPVGGMDAIARKLADAVGRDRITTSTQVTKITNVSDGVEVVHSGGSITADYCVAALPPHILARIPGNLGAEVLGALRTPRPLAAGKIGLEYRRRWWETDDRIYGGITETDLDISHIWYPSYGFHGARGLVVGYYNLDAAANSYAAMKHADRQRRAIENGVRIHGDKYRTEVLSSVSIAWRRQSHIEGSWVEWPSYGPQFKLLQEPAGRVYFAGDWLTHLIAWQAGALGSARKVVTELHQRVLKEG